MSENLKGLSRPSNTNEFNSEDLPDSLSSFEQELAQQFKPIPQEFRQACSPSRYFMFEWREYYLRYPGADRMLVGTEWLGPLPSVTGVFRLRLENRLGVTRLQPYSRGHPIEPPVYVEVISPKFPDLDQHLSFLKPMIEDLFARATRLPFFFRGETGRGAAESLRPPTPLFMLHFLNQYNKKIQDAIAIIQASPHRRLYETIMHIPLTEVNEVDGDVLVDILHNPNNWTKVSADSFPLAEKLQGFAPVQVRQRQPYESFDTPENRFVFAFIRQILAAAEMLQNQRWWPNVPWKRQRIIQDTINHMRHTIHQSPFSEVGVMRRLPMASQVLLRREGYREMLELWQVFQQARRPLFAPFEHAVEVRDVATLYEMWVFFALVEEFGTLLGESPVIELNLSAEHGLGWSSRARFGRQATLEYNLRRKGYSVYLRPDFTWSIHGRLDIVLDAKFRLEHIYSNSEDYGRDDVSIASLEDIYKMHTYRDALGVRAAVSIYPGDQSQFFHSMQSNIPNIELKDILEEDITGVGVLSFKPSL